MTPDTPRISAGPGGSASRSLIADTRLGRAPRGSAFARLEKRKAAADKPPVDVPACTFDGFLEDHARVRLPDGRYVKYGFEKRSALRFVAEILSKVVRNTVGKERVEIEGIEYAPGSLKGSTVSICGGAQFGKTVLELNYAGWATTVEFLNFGFYTSDLALLSTIVDTKFRPDVVDQVAWMPAMIDIGKSEGKGGRSVNRKNAYQVSNAGRKAFGYFNGMQKPPTTISLDIAALDEVDDIPEKNIGFIAGRMTNSDVQLTCYIGTQRVHGAGQNARWLAGTMHRRMVTCPDCGARFCLAESWPGITRVAMDGQPSRTDPRMDETMQFDPDANYYPGCLECAAPLDPESGIFEAEHPEKARYRNWSIRISQMDIGAIKWRDITARWFAALADPDPGALAAWHCDARAIPLAGAAQPVTPSVVSRAKACGRVEVLDPAEPPPVPYAMSLARQGVARVCGMDTGPRCWLWANDLISERAHALTWAEMIPSGQAFARCVELLTGGLTDIIFLDAGGEPDLTKRICLALNGLADYQPPAMPIEQLRRAYLGGIGNGVSWDGNRGRWSNIKAAAVLFSQRPGAGIQEDIAVTQDGRIYPIIKCNRAEAIQGFVNTLLTPAEGVIQHIAGELRSLPIQRLPENSIGAGVTATMIETHLTNLRRGRKAGQSEDDWLDGIENHLGLAAVYARIAAMSAASAPAQPFHYRPVATATGRNLQQRSVHLA
jgi:hypothetical protein